MDRAPVAEMGKQRKHISRGQGNAPPRSSNVGACPSLKGIADLNSAVSSGLLSEPA